MPRECEEILKIWRKFDVRSAIGYRLWLHFTPKLTDLGRNLHRTGLPTPRKYNRYVITDQRCKIRKITPLFVGSQTTPFEIVKIERTQRPWPAARPSLRI